MYKSKNGSVKVTRLELEHTNHAINEATHRFKNESLNDEERDLVKTFKEANTKTSQIKKNVMQPSKQEHIYAKSQESHHQAHNDIVHPY